MANWPFPLVTSPIDIPATGFLIGTPASIRARVAAQVLAIEVLPLEARASATTLTVYGNSSSSGSTASSALSANAPWPTSRLPGDPTRPVSPVL